MTKYWREITIAILITLIVGQWASGFYADRRLERLRQKSEAKSAEIQGKVDSLNASVSSLTTENTRLRTDVVRPLERRLSSLSHDLSAARELHETAITVVDMLGSSDVIRETVTSLELGPDQVRITPTGEVLFTADAARTNLRYLLEAELTRTELELTVQKVVTLETLLTTEREFGRNQTKIIEDIRARESLIGDQHQLRVGVLKAEISAAQRARLRRVTTYIGVGLVAGTLLASL